VTSTTPLNLSSLLHMFVGMDQERQEVYERIPWETLERKGRDPNRMVIAVAGAVALGALAFSFVRNQPASPVAPAPAPVVEAASAPTLPVAPAATVATPLVVAEADLYAVDEERLLDLARAHAEWFAVEYFAVDGSEQSRASLASLLPEGVPVPEAPPGIQVFVDWARAWSVSEVAALVYQVEVIVKSLVSGPDGGFTRQPTRAVTIEVMIGADGSPRVTRPPTMVEEPRPAPHSLPLTGVPDQVRESVEATHGPVVGGEQLAGGGYLVVAMVTDSDGVTRPRTVLFP